MHVILKNPPKNPLGLEDNCMLYHYTTLDSLLGIIRANNVFMWATHYQYLNDREEIINGIKAIKKHMPFVNEEMFNNLFILSFSKTVDSLTMWRTYSNDYSGCILGFRNNCLGGNRIHCCYDEGESEKRIIDAQKLLQKGQSSYIDKSGSLRVSQEQLISDSLKNYSLQQIAISAVIGTKNNNFEYEKEVRSYIILEDKSLSVINFRNKNNVIIPYIECEASKDALKEIWLPNKETTRLTSLAIQKLLTQYGYNDVEIKISSCSYRSV